MFPPWAGRRKGIIKHPNRRYRGVGADIMIRPKNSRMLGLGSAPIPERLVDFIRKQPHAALATGMVMQSLGNPFSTAPGVDVDQFNRLSGGLEQVHGRGP